ncbi:MAG: IclR family transcriptional regulator [Candidatus Limnocylindrales bacterium]
MPPDRATDRATARDRPPEEAAEDTSFARGLRVFLAVADRGEIRADELGAILETPVSTIYRYLRTLTEFGFVERGESGYHLGPRLQMTGGPTVASEELIRLADPVLRMLVEMTGETALIARRVGQSAVCLHEAQSPQPLRVTCAPGTAIPLQAGSLSRVLLAYAPASVRADALALVGDPSAVHRELNATVADGIAQEQGGMYPGTVSIAVPVMRRDGIVAAIGVLAPTGRATRAWRTRAARSLHEGSTIIGTALGSHPRP